MNAEDGKPGEPGQPGQGLQGGEGGAGGTGGEGEIGGAGGEGGSGGGVSTQRRRSIVAYVVLCLTMAVALYVLTENVRSKADIAALQAVDGELQDVDREFTANATIAVRNCRRANVDAALERTAATVQLRPIIDCDEGVHRRPLAPLEQREYVRIVKKGRMPRVRDGQVVGSTRLRVGPGGI